LGLNFDKTKRIAVPRPTDLGEKISNEIVVVQNKRGIKTYIAELNRPASNVSQAMTFFMNKHLHYKEVELRSEKDKLDLQEEQIKKRRNILSANANVNKKFII
jgi:hypothetical protein